MLGQILAFVARIFGLTNQLVNLANQILTLVTGVQTILGTPAQEHSVTDVLTDTDTIITMLNDPIIGLAAIKFEIQAQATGLVAVINTLPQVGDPVVLPTTPPTGYGSPSDSDLFNAVWTGLKSPDVVTPYEFLRVVGTRTEFVTGYASLAQADANFYFSNPNYNEFGAVGSFYPVFDLALMISTDDLLSFVTTCNPDATVVWTPSTGLQVFVSGDNGDGTVNFITVWNEATFQQLKATLFPLASGVVAPVWPGLSGVTLGTPVTITSQMTITDPMDGVIVDITSVTTNKPSLAYDTELAYKFIGALAFVSDNGDVETFQPLAFTHALYCPQRMARAISVVLRVDAGVAGTVTPWVAV